VTAPRVYLRAQEIAQLCGVSLRTVRRWIASGALPSTKMGGVRLVAKESLETVLFPASQNINDKDDKNEVETANSEYFGKKYSK
jgi:excisionase family DNA binding protein